MSSLPAVTGRVRRGVPILLRLLAVTITLYPAIRKFTEYSYRVSEFQSYGMPWPELTVVLTGLIELAAIVSIAFGIAGRLGAGALAVGMVVAIVAAGPNPFSVLVFLSSVGIYLFGTGPYSYWSPTPGELFESQPTALVPGSASGGGE